MTVRKRGGGIPAAFSVLGRGKGGREASNGGAGLDQ